jgi:hypothetical protein
MLKNKLVSAMALLVLASCGSPTQPAASSPDDTVSNTPGDGGGTTRGGAQRVEPRDGLVDPHPTSWDKYKKRSSNTVDLYLWSGVEECYGIDHIDVAYKRRVVEVTIFEGNDPDAQQCIELAVRKVVRLELDEPLGRRTLIDGGQKA